MMYYGSEPLYICKDCSDEAYRRIVTRCYGVKELFIKGGESVSFKPNDFYGFFNTSCIPLSKGLIWVNITSDKLVKVIIHSKVFEGVNIMYGCIGMKNVTITTYEDSRVVVEVREITPCIYSKPYTDFYRIYEALPNLHDDQDCS
jgi:hypothetical protein